MALYKNTLEALLKAYPRLYVDESDVLNYLFFVNGNGMIWEYGQLRMGCDLGDLVFFAHHEAPLTHWGPCAKNYTGTLENHIEEQREKELKYRREIAEHGSDSYIIMPDGSLSRKIYPICRYAHIMHIPKDVHSDWLGAAIKAINMARHEWRHTAEDLKMLNKAKVPPFTP